MRGVFDQEETERPEHGQDRELTLGSGALLALFFGLVVLCGLCFGLGYAIGHGGSQTTAAGKVRPTPEQEPLQASGNIPKPSAIAQTPVAPPPDATATDQATGAAGAVVGQTTGPQALSPVQPPAQAPVQPAAATQLQVHPALASGNLLQPYSAGAAQNARSAPPSQSFMVQIAAVSNPQDAEVLVGALHKRNYPVLARREPADNFIHVRIGPFATRALAEQWRMKLLNDGYNAELQP